MPRKPNHNSVASLKRLLAEITAERDFLRDRVAILEEKIENSYLWLPMIRNDLRDRKRPKMDDWEYERRLVVSHFLSHLAAKRFPPEDLSQMVSAVVKSWEEKGCPSSPTELYE